MYRFLILSIVCVAFMFSACKETPENKTSTSTDEITIGPDGGRVSVSNGAYIIVQPGTFQIDTILLMSVLAVDVPLDVQASDVIAIQPAQVNFNKPVTLVIPYSGGGNNPLELQIYWSDNPNAPIQNWQAVDSTVDPIQNVVSAHIEQFGYFVVGIADSNGSDSGTDHSEDSSTSVDSGADTETGVSTDSATMIVTSTDSATETAIDTHVDTVDTDTGVDTGTDGGLGTDNPDTNTDTGGDLGTDDPDTDTGTGTGEDFCAVSPCVHGTCTNLASSYSCECELGYAGTTCGNCASGYQDNDNDGICVGNCETSELDCGVGGECDDSSGAVVCDCDTGYTGASCGNCVSGYQDNDANGTCFADCETAGLTCTGNSLCDDTNGTAICVCSAGYTGAACSDCAPGYQDNDGDGICVENCATASLDCGPNGTCDDTGGAAICECDANYTGAACSDCAPGFQDNDNNGVCLPTCGQLGWTCSENGVCDDSSGQAVCDCEIGYTPDGTGGCYLTGYTCLEAIEIPVGTYPVSGTVTGTTTGAGENYGTTCTSATSSEMVYSFTLTESSLVTFSTAGSDFDTVIHLRSDCEDPADELACSDDFDGTPQSYIELLLEPGNYSVFVDGWSTHSGDYILTYTMASNPCAPNPCTTEGQTTCVVDAAGYICGCDSGWISDGAGGCVPDTGVDSTCDNAETLSTTGLPLSASVTGTTTSAGYNYFASCGMGGSATVGAESEEVVYSFTVSEPVFATFSTAGSDYDSVLHIRSDCEDDASEIACNDDLGEDIYQSYLELLLDPGTYSVFVDGFYDSIYGESGDYTLSYTMVANPCASVTCGVNEECQPSGDWLSYTCECATGFVDDGSGACVLNSSATGYDCSDPIVLPAEDVPLSRVISGTNAGSGANYSGTCSFDDAALEVVHTFTVIESVLATFSTEGSSYDTLMYIRSDCTSDTLESELGCNDDYSGMGFQSYLELTLDPGTYSVFVDSFEVGELGDYTLTYTLSAL